MVHGFKGQRDDTDPRIQARPWSDPCCWHLPPMIIGLWNRPFLPEPPNVGVASTIYRLDPPNHHCPRDGGGRVPPLKTPWVASRCPAQQRQGLRRERHCNGWGVLRFMIEVNRNDSTLGGMRILSLQGNKRNWTEWVELWSANELFWDG